jgi:O-antigen ligase
MIRSMALPSRSLFLVVSLLLFLAPASNLVWRGGTGYGFFVLLAIGLCAAIANAQTRGYFAPLRTYRWYTAAMAVFLVVAVLQQAVLGYWAPRQFDAMSRFALALPIFLLLCRMPSRPLTAVGWGCAAGAVAANVWVFVDRPAGGWTDAMRLNNYFTNAIPFGDTALLLAFLAVFTFGWDRPRDWRTLAPKVIAMIAGGYASYLSGTRGGWLAIPVFVVLLAMQYRWFAHKKRMIIAATAIVVCGAIVLFSPRVEQRIVDASSDLQELQHGSDFTSVGQRVQLWRASLQLFAENPLYGVGKGRLKPALERVHERGGLEAQTVNERAHSDFFSTIAELGAIGVVSLLVFYFGTSVYFWRNLRAADDTVRTAAYSGLALSFSTIIFGLTIDVLVPVMVTVLIALLTATFLAIIHSRKAELTLEALAPASHVASSASSPSSPSSAHDRESAAAR